MAQGIFCFCAPSFQRKERVHPYWLKDFVGVYQRGYGLSYGKEQMSVRCIVGDISFIYTPFF